MKKLKNLLISFTVIALNLNLYSISYSQDNLIQNLENKLIPNIDTETNKNKEQIKWYDIKRGMFISEQNNKFVLLNFCVNGNEYCNKLDNTTFKNSEIIKILNEKFVTVNVDAYSQDPLRFNGKLIQEKDLIKFYKIGGYPTIIFINPKGETISGNIKGYIEPENLLLVLKYISSESYKDTKFKDFVKGEKRKR